MTETGPQDEAATLCTAAEELRRRMRADGPVAVNIEYVLFAVARLLDELGKALATGHHLEHHAADAALEIAHHVLHRDQAGHTLRHPDQGDA
ncbi:hypothetical protein LWP59_19455 [Amycolatopsis acidiphila]|uniref:Uncharacterized protein n=1 Tax=Amycolatopsis acidiphila TaxID=715473 RepID=A0A558ACN4_9PSEU|nr:hypothetical protein [Amycolatopsis acidiphila]TVT22030.1 hypothetical protein FNH06_14820 [Amycolatopsis acidiphila]UIJ63652.1 hypothetical protein LWP59_19455 [Amycolatopsis acidiphila]GHG67674.1 hypothetical protein GCM10017788_26750 [Amycolatopsis acidiphila]